MLRELGNTNPCSRHKKPLPYGYLVVRRPERSDERLASLVAKRTMTVILTPIIPQDDLQIPATLRPKLATMDPSVKAAFLKSSHVLAEMRPPASANPPLTPRGLRKAHSSESLASMASPRPKKPSLEQYDLSPAPSRRFVSGHSRGVSMDVRRQAFDTAPIPVAPLKTNKDKKKAAVITPEKYVGILLGHSSTTLDIEVVKKLRLLLRNESARSVHMYHYANLFSSLTVGRMFSCGRADTKPSSPVSTRS